VFQIPHLIHYDPEGELSPIKRVGSFYLQIDYCHILFAVKASFLSKLTVCAQMLLQVFSEHCFPTVLIGTGHRLK
jgi:hypothetical protein